MNILVLNAGSSSLKYQLIDMKTEMVIAKGCCERVTQDNSKLEHTVVGKEKIVINKDMPDHVKAIELVIEALTSEQFGVVKSLNDINAVGHRVLHAGVDFTGSVVITDETLKTIKKNKELGPLHMPANIAVIEACKKVMPKTPMVAVFDTAFHSTMPDYAYMYALPYNFYQEMHVRKYGFHGTSHKFVSSEAIKYLKKPNSKIVTCHLGNGSSLAAVKDGKCIDTSMGFTPLEGLLMGTRSGDIDPAVLEFVMNKKGYSISEMLNILNKKSGVYGISQGMGGEKNAKSDFRDLAAGRDSGDKYCDLALKMFVYRVRKYIGSYAVAMNGLDCIVITGGIGENTPRIRKELTENLEFMGVKLDSEKNEKAGKGNFAEISADDSSAKILVIPTNEELVIARETLELI